MDRTPSAAPQPPQTSFAARHAGHQLFDVAIFADSALAKLQQGKLPNEAVLAAVEAAPSAPYTHLRALQHLGTLDALHHHLAEHAGARPPVWHYPPFVRQLPQYPTPELAWADPEEVRASNAQQTAAAHGQWLVPSAYALWQQLLVDDAQAQLQGAAPSLTPLINRVSNAADEATQRDPRAVQAPQDETALASWQQARRRDKQAAQLLVMLAVHRGHWSAVAPALNRYATLAAHDTQVRYEALPLQPAVLHTWLENCPGGALAYVDLWQEGLRQVVDKHTFALVYGRVHQGQVPLRRIDRYLQDAAAHGRVMDRSVAHAYAAATACSPLGPYCDGLQRAAELTRHALNVGKAPDDAWPQVPAFPQTPAAPRRDRAQLAAQLVAAGRVDPWALAKPELLLRFTEVIAHAPEPVLEALWQAYAPRLRDPFVGAPLLVALTDTQSPSALADKFVTLTLRLPGAEVALGCKLLALAAKHDDALAYAKVLRHLERFDLRWHPEVVATLAAHRCTGLEAR